MADGESASPPPRTPSDDTPTDEEIPRESTADQKIIEVKCGPLTARMHVEQFVCPGIHQVCIELDGEMISPKEFTIRANKDKQKDWKGSIRIGKSNLRTLMEMRTFDFYNHTQFCSAKCQSRNYITPKEKDPERDSRRNSTASQKGSQLPLFSNPLLGQQNLGATGIFKDNSTFNQLMQLSSVLNNNNQNLIQTKIEPKEELVDVDDSFTEVSSTPSPPSPEQLLRLMNTEPQLFWSEIRQLGLLDEAIDQIVATIYKSRDSASNGGLAVAAPVLSRIVASLSITDSILNLVRIRQIHRKASDKPRLSSDFSYLEDGVESRKRSLDEGSSVPQTSPEVKRPRVQYPVGVTPADVVGKGIESNFIQALLQAQLQLCQPQLDILMHLPKAPIPLANPLLSISKE